jgi:aminopeptidase-like protein
LPSRNGDTLSDNVARHVLKNLSPTYKSYSWSDRGSDERQYCGPGIRLPVVTLCRTKFGEFPEYHTSLDNLTDVVTPKGLQGGFDYVVNCIEILESNSIWQSKYPCEPRMGKIGLYPNVMSHKIPVDTVMLMNLLAYLDGESDLLEVAEKINLPFKACLKLLEILEQNNLIVKNDSKKQS